MPFLPQLLFFIFSYFSTSISLRTIRIKCSKENAKARHPTMSRLSNIIVNHSKLLISTTLHEHGTESQCDGGEDNRGEECDCDHSSIFLIVSILVFSHCKDRPYSLTLQVFSSLFASDIATLPAYGDKYREHLIFLSRCPHFFIAPQCIRLRIQTLRNHRRS